MTQILNIVPNSQSCILATSAAYQPAYKTLRSDANRAQLTGKMSGSSLHICR